MLIVAFASAMQYIELGWIDGTGILAIRDQKDFEEGS